MLNAGNLILFIDAVSSLIDPRETKFENQAKPYAKGSQIRDGLRRAVNFIRKDTYKTPKYKSANLVERFKEVKKRSESHDILTEKASTQLVGQYERIKKQAQSFNKKMAQQNPEPNPPPASPKFKAS